MLGSHQRSACIDEGLLLDKDVSKKGQAIQDCCREYLYVAFPTQPENFLNMIDI
jgi:hypothetical protein